MLVLEVAAAAAAEVGEGVPGDQGPRFKIGC